MNQSNRSDPSNYRDQLNSHLDGVQGDLEALKEFLRDGDNYQVDANTLLSVSNEYLRFSMVSFSVRIYFSGFSIVNF